MVMVHVILKMLSLTVQRTTPMIVVFVQVVMLIKIVMVTVLEMQF